MCSTLLISILIATAFGEDLQRLVLNEIHPLLVNCTSPYIIFKDLNVSRVQYDAFRWCSQTKVVDFSNNQIRVIHSTAFKGLHALRELYLSYNLIEKIEVGTLQPLTRLEVLDLSGNFLVTLPEGEIRSSKLRYLNCNGNRLTSIPNDVMKNIIDLLDLSNNNLKKIEAQSLKSIKSGLINLSNNKLKSIAFQIDIPFTDNTTTFLASGNRIPNIMEGSLGTLYNLKIVNLDLSFNRIDFIDGGAFDLFLYLKHLYLSHNNLVWLPTNILFNLQDLILLDLSHNHISNNIFSLYYPNSIRYLNYSYNFIFYIDDFDWLPEMGYIQELNVMHNRLTCLDGSLVSNQIKSISLGYNDWECSALYNLLVTLENRGIKALGIQDVNDFHCKLEKDFFATISKRRKISMVNQRNVTKIIVEQMNFIIYVPIFISLLLIVPFFL